MALPTGRSNMVGVMVEASASELGLQVGQSLANGSTTTGNEITIPVPCTALLVCKLASGTATVKLDAYATTADFNSPDASFQVTRGEPVYLVANSSATNTKMQVQIVNQAGTALTIQELRLLVLAKQEDKEDYYTRANALDSVVGKHGDGVGTWVLT